MVESAGFENQYTRKGIRGSNPLVSAKLRFLVPDAEALDAAPKFFGVDFLQVVYRT